MNVVLLIVLIGSIGAVANSNDWDTTRTKASGVQTFKDAKREAARLEALDRDSQVGYQVESCFDEYSDQLKDCIQDVVDSCDGNKACLESVDSWSAWKRGEQ